MTTPPVTVTLGTSGATLDDVVAAHGRELAGGRLDLHG